MLVLKRQVGEQLVLDVTEPCRIVVEVHDIQGKAARVGIQAPQSVRVLRRELLDHANAATPETAP